MSVTDFTIPGLALSLVLVEIFVEKEKFPNLKKQLLIWIGIFTFGFSIWASWQNTKTSDRLQEASDSLLVNQQRVETGQKDLQIAQLKNSIAQKMMSDSQNAILERLYVDGSVNSKNFAIKLDKLKKYNDSLLALQQDPVLDILPGNFPILKKEWNGLKDVLVIVVNEIIDGAISANESFKINYIGIQGNNIVELDSARYESGSNIHHTLKSIAIGLALNVNSLDFSQYNVFIHLRIDYTNLDGKKLKPLIRVFQITNEYDKGFKPVFDNNYKRVIDKINSRR